MQQALIDSTTQNTTVISMLFEINKIKFIKYTRDMAQWPIFLTIGNLNYKI